MTTKKPKKRVKAASTKQSAEVRRCLFAEAYLSSGQNATKAAIAAGFSPASAAAQGSRLLKHVKVQQIINSRRTVVLAEARENTGVTVEQTIAEAARLAFSDVGKLVGEDGKLLLPHQLDPATRAAVASFEIDEYGKIKYKFWDKNASLDKLFRYQGLYEADNRQRGDLLAGLPAEVVTTILERLRQLRELRNEPRLVGSSTA